MSHLPENGNTLERMMLSRAAAAQRPISGTLELLPLCNMNCDMCYIRLSREEMEERGRLHTAEEWIRLGKQMQEAGVLFLLLTGGEPLLFPGFRELYTSLRGMGMILTVNTNGTLLDEEWADFFGAQKPRRINITLYGADDEAYRTLCHYPGGYTRALRAIRLLRERGVDVKINGSVTRSNRKDMDGIYETGRELGVPVHMDTYMLPGIHEIGLPFEQQSRLSPEEAAEAEIRVLKAEMDPEDFPKYAAALVARTEKEGEVYPEHLSCMAGSCSFAVGWQGEMRPCVTLSEPSASVFEEGFETAWKTVSEQAKQLCVNEACTRCRMRPVCRTCAAGAKLETGQYDGIPEYLCRYSEEFLRLLRRETENERDPA